MKKHKADWLGWSLQTFVGFLIGAALGFSLATGKQFEMWVFNIETEVAIYFIGGLGLIFGAFATQFCEKVWITFWNGLPPDEIEQTIFSRLSSALIAILGIGLVSYAVWMTI